MSQEQIFEKVDVEYKSEGKYPIECILLKPSGAGRRPGIMVCPGRNASRMTSDMDWLAGPLADAGYVALSITYRRENGVYLKTDIRDIMDGISYLSSLDFVDLDQIGIVGRSRGAMSGLITAAQDPRVKTVIAQGTTTDRIRSVTSLKDYAPTRYKTVVGFVGPTPQEDPEHYKAISPITYADRIKAPVYMITGTSDLYAPLDQAVWMIDALKAHGNTSSKVEILDRVGHFLETPNGKFAYEEVAKLIISWLKDKLPVNASGVGERV